MMNFRTVKAAVVTLLGAAAAGRFTVIGYQTRGQAAAEVKDSSRTVQVFFSRGEFPKSGGGMSGPVRHNLTIRLELLAGAAAKGDLATLNDENATAVQMAAAIAAFQQASDAADESFDELADIVYQIMMDAENYDLGLDPGEVSSRWIGSIDKSEPTPRGEYVVIPGTLEMTCTVSEVLVGDTGQPADPSLGAVLAEVETHTPPDTETADPAQAGIRGGD